MANTIKLKSSAVAGKVPTTTDLALRELGVNTTDGKLYLKKSVAGVESIVEVTGAGGGGGATGAGGDQVFLENSKTVTTSYTLSANKNAVSAGPISINDGVVITIPSSQSWVIV